MALAAVGCAGEVTRGERPVIVGRPVPRSDAAGSTTDARTPSDGGLDASPDAATRDDAGTGHPPPEPVVYVRVATATPEIGLRAALEPPQGVEADPLVALAALDTPSLVPVFEYGRPDDLAETRARARLASGRPATMLFRPDLSPETIDADVRRLAAWILETPAVSRFEDRPLLFVEGAPAGPALSAALTHLAGLPHPPAVALNAALDTPAGAALPPELPAVAARLVSARFTTPAEGYGLDGGGALPDRPVRAGFGRAREALAAGSAVWPTIRAARNPRLDEPDAPVEPPGDDEALARSLVRARRLGAPAIFLEALGAHRDDRQLDAISGTGPTGAPSALTAGWVYAPHGDRRLSLVRQALLVPPVEHAVGWWPGGGTPPVVLDRSEGVTLHALTFTPPRAVSGGRWGLELEDRTATGRLEVLVDLTPFVVPPAFRLAYERDRPAVRVELAPAGSGPEPRPDLLRARSADAPPEGRVSLPIGDLAGRVVDEVLIVYEGGAARLSATVRDLRLEPDAP